MEIKFQGQYDKATFYKAVRLANQPSGEQRRFLWLMLFFALGALIVMLYRIVMTGDWAGNAVLLGAAVLMAIVVGGLFLQPLFAARRMWANPGTRRFLKGEITRAGVIYQLEAGRNEISWGRISRMRQEEDLVALVRDDGLLLIFPRRFFQRDSDWRKFMKFIGSKLEGR